MSPQISEASATTEAANIQASSVTTQSKKAHETKRVTAKAAQGPQSPTGSESVTIQIKSPLKALNLSVIPQTTLAPLASESGNSQALVASIKPKKASRIRPFIIPLRSHWLQTPSTQLPPKAKSPMRQPIPRPQQLPVELRKPPKTRGQLLKAQILTLS